jgi:hypothetical protein
MPSTSKKQHNFMAAVAKNPGFAKKVGIPRSVGEEFLTADKGKKFREGGAMKKNPFMEMIAKKKEAAAMKDAPAKKSAKPFAKGGMAKCAPAAKKEVKAHEKRMHGMKAGGMTCGTKRLSKGGGIETKGKTKGRMC